MCSRARKLKGALPGIAATGSAKQRTLLSYFSKSMSSKKTNASTDGSDNLELDIIQEHTNQKELQHNAADDDKQDDNIQTPRKKLKTSDSECNSVLEAQRLRLAAKSKDLNIIDQNIGLSWFVALEKEFDKDYFKALNNFVEDGRRDGIVYPPSAHVWEWTRHCSIHDIKVVILGQDPYHGPGQAHGLCFSVLNVAPPPSLLNMYKELENDIGAAFKKPNHGCLVGWATQGVLLLNSVLTVNAGQPNSHKDRGWEKLTDATIAWISANLNSVVFLLWGAYAQKKGAIVDKKKHHVLQTVHPSPLSCHRGFFGCKHFSKCNEILKKNGKKPIDWNHLPNV